MHSIWAWIGFNLFVILMLAVDLGLFHRTAHRVKMSEAAVWSAVWVTLAIIFGIGVHYFIGPRAGLEYFTGYLIEKALSVDNIFVFVVIFTYFKVPPEYQHRVLFWGVLGALIMRGIMIAAGVVLIREFSWILYVFGAFLIFTGIKMAFQSEHSVDPSHNPVLRLIRRIMPVTDEYHGQKFFTKRPIKGKLRRAATPMLVVLAVVESTDVVFAVDSIPAIFAITQDPFIVYTSNIFAILGLRALYFLLAGSVEKFHYLRYGLSAVLVFVGIKMVVAKFLHVPIGLSLGVVGGLLAISVVASLMRSRRRESEHANADRSVLSDDSSDSAP